jgi:hypothetical protein
MGRGPATVRHTTTMKCFRCERTIFKRPAAVVPLPHGQAPAFYGPKCAILAGFLSPTPRPRRPEGAQQKPQAGSPRHMSTKAGTQHGQVDWIAELEAEAHP